VSHIKQTKFHEQVFLELIHDINLYAFFENVDVSKSKFEQVVLELFNFVYLSYRRPTVGLKDMMCYDDLETCVFNNYMSTYYNLSKYPSIKISNLIYHNNLFYIFVILIL